MAKDDKVNGEGDKALDAIIHKLVDLVLLKAAEHPDLHIRQFMVSAKDMGHIVELARGVKGLIKKNQKPDDKQMQVIHDVLEHTFHNAQPLSDTQSDMIVEAVTLLEKQQADQDATEKWFKEMSGG